MQEFVIDESEFPGYGIRYRIPPLPNTRLHKEVRAARWRWWRSKARWWVYVEFDGQVELAFGPFKDYSWAAANRGMINELIDMKWIRK